ncbi:MAG: 4Fe-4S binding protein [Thermodesulfobacteriota bacterium]|jgi:ferredoxin|nr:MAG: 4Fe-4S binding protein [Thermodesulfobacteriota bacterium]
MKVKRKIIHIEEDKCDGCGQCVPSCAEGAIQVIDGKAKLISQKYCDGLGACLGTCPNDALKVTEQDVEEFDEKAVEAHLKTKESPLQQETMPCVCPSAQIRTFAPHAGKPEPANIPVQESALTHWPVQIRLVPPKAPFLKGADLLVAADCTPIAYPNFHADFLKGKAVMVGCPKFDDVEAYIQKFTEIFKTADVKSITVVVMEVPCCQGLPFIVHKGLELANKKIPFEKVIISAQGEILKRENLAA